MIEKDRVVFGLLQCSYSVMSVLVIVVVKVEMIEVAVWQVMIWQFSVLVWNLFLWIVWSMWLKGEFMMCNRVRKMMREMVKMR